MGFVLMMMMIMMMISVVTLFLNQPSKLQDLSPSNKTLLYDPTQLCILGSREFLRLINKENINVFNKRRRKSCLKRHWVSLNVINKRSTFSLFLIIFINLRSSSKFELFMYRF